MRNKIIALAFFSIFGCDYAAPNIVHGANNVFNQLSISSKAASDSPDLWKKKSKTVKNKSKDGLSIIEDSLFIMMKDSLSEIRKRNLELDKTNKHLRKSETRKDQQVRILQNKADSLQRETKRLEMTISDQIVSTFGTHLNDANAFFCRAVMESPLFYKFDSERVKHSIDISKSMGYDNKANKYNWIYSVYSDLLVNYELFNQELIDNVSKVITQFSFTAKRELEKERFEARLIESEYYKIRGQGKYGTYRHIFYLDFQIERLRELFKSDASFKKNNFEEVRNAL